MNTNEIKVGSQLSTKLEYVTRENRLASQRQGRSVRIGYIKYKGTIQIAEIAKQIADSGFMGKKEDVLYFTSALSDVVPKYLQAGYIVNWGDLISMKAVLKGVMGEGNLYSPKTNTLAVKATIGPALRKSVENCSVTCVDGLKVPKITDLTNLVDMASGILYAESRGHLKGKNLEFDTTASDEGITIDCSGGDISVTILKMEADEVSFLLNGEIEQTCEGTLTFASRGGDRNRSEPMTISIPVTLKPAE